MTKEELEAIEIERPSEELRRRIKARWDKMAKPLDGMGKFEELTAQIGAILGREDLDIRKKAVLVLCADNGIVKEGVSQSGQEVTRRVSAAMGKNATCVGKMADSIGADVIPVDIGINAAESPEGVLDRKLARGTRDFLIEPAMTEPEMLAAIQVGMELAGDCREKGYHLLAVGEMGIGNTTTASAVAAALTGCKVSECVGRGAGLGDQGLERKRQVIENALLKYTFRAEETLRILQTVGGLDIAGMAGVCLGAAKYHLPVVMDGVISMVAALIACRLKPQVRDYLIPSHQSKEPVAVLLAKELGVSPVIDASMALGEGTGAVMMFALLDMAVTLYQQHSRFDDIGVEQYIRF